MPKPVTSKSFPNGPSLPHRKKKVHHLIQNVVIISQKRCEHSIKVNLSWRFLSNVTWSFLHAIVFILSQPVNLHRAINTCTVTLTAYSSQDTGHTPLHRPPSGSQGINPPVHQPSTQTHTHTHICYNPPLSLSPHTICPPKADLSNPSASDGSNPPRAARCTWPGGLAMYTSGPPAASASKTIHFHILLIHQFNEWMHFWDFYEKKHS